MQESLISAIGNTPLVRVPFAMTVPMYAKLEYLNPGGSIKDRTAAYIITQAIKEGTLQTGNTIIEASSGNQGIATALIGAALGYPVIVVAPERSSTEKIATMRAYGAQVIICPSTTNMNSSDSYHSVAQALHDEIPHSFLLNQYYNHENPLAHYYGIGPEIWEQTNHRVTHVIVAAGTCGSISGIGKFLKEKNPTIKIYGVDSETSYRSTHGNPKTYQMEGIGVDIDSPLLNMEVIDDMLTVADEEVIDMVKILARQYGFLVGLSSGAVAVIAQKIGLTCIADDLIVLIFADSGRAYLSKNYYATQESIIHYRQDVGCERSL